ncbi:MAG: lactate dehydrogenase [Methanomicrobiales archaeon]|nr:lactate dehydrogenase [Methanomicrobiales archaeon]MDI6876862.1 lactate dehydrogenase [Methanomicrobiales archaeon]
MTSLAVMGTGRVGGEVAFLASVMGIVDELILHDIYSPLLHAQVLDLQHAMPYLDISTDLSRMRDADICIFAAGSGRTPHVKTRADLIGANLPVAAACTRYLEQFSGIFITVSNPVDVLNYYLCRRLGLDPARCIGFGGQVDSARFQIQLLENGIDGEGYVMGEHGEHQVPLFSQLPVQVDLPKKEEILSALRGMSMKIIEGKGATTFGPSAHIVDLVDMISEDAGSIITASAVVDGEYGLSGCSIGVPIRIGGEGIEGIEEWQLDEWERERFEEAGAFVKALCASLDV